VAEALWTLEAPVDPRLLPPACGDRGKPGLFLPFGSGARACALFSTGDEQAGGDDRPSAWEGWKEGEVGRALGTLRAGGVEVGAGLQGDAARGHQGLDQQGIGGADALIGGARCGRLESVAARGDDVCRAYRVVAESGLQGGAARVGPLCGWASDAERHRKCASLSPEPSVAPAGRSFAASW
jgi:hypothetical protein